MRLLRRYCFSCKRKTRYHWGTNWKDDHVNVCEECEHENVVETADYLMETGRWPRRAPLGATLRKVRVA